MIRRLVVAAAALVAIAYVLRQVRKPDRWIGRLFLWAMNRSHAGLTSWGLEQVRIERSSIILDVGCGGGAAIRRMAGLAADGRVCGVDYAGGSVAASRAANARLIEAGRVEVQQASVERLPYPEGMFDLVTAVETHYYWPDLDRGVREIQRVLKPGGTLLILAESYRGGTGDQLQGPVMSLMGAHRLTADAHGELLSRVGYADVRVTEERRHGWISVTGRKS